MKRLLTTLLVLISLGLCTVSVVQWQRETRLRGHILDLIKRLEAENAMRIEAERKVREYEKEIARLTELRAEVEAKLVEVSREYNDLSRDSTARGISIAVYMREVAQMQHGLEATQVAFGKGTAALKDHNAVVTTQNSGVAPDQRCRLILGHKRPRVGLLTIGTEEGKGNELTNATHELLKQLVEERNDAISKLNARTLEFNEIVEKYNKLAKSR